MIYNYVNTFTSCINKNVILKDFVRSVATKLETSSKWNTVIGLEIHAQLLTKSKLFSGAPTDYNSAVNANVSLFDAAIPGTLPVLNQNCVEYAVRTASALSCSFNTVSYFDRKHYFYADMPSGYQITQQRMPLAYDGHLKFPVYTPGIHKTPYTKVARIKQLQIEQDSGKSLHDVDNCYSLVDLNRAGVPLIEIVFEPDLSDGEEAAALIKELTIILQRLKTCSCKMEEGALRVDANISVNREGEPLGTRTEVKNIGSIRGVASAIKYEIERQINVRESGGVIINETRSWDAQNKKTIAMRDKETLQDYRYMPEPNLPPLQLNTDLTQEINNENVNIELCKKSLPELPELTRDRLVNKIQLTFVQALILVNEPILLNLFESIIENEKIDPKVTVNILINEFLSITNRNKLNLEKINVSVSHLSELIEIFQDKMINIVIARKILEEIINGNELSPKEIIKENNWSLIKDDGDIIGLCKNVIDSNPQIVQQYINGKKKVFGALLGKVAAVSKDRANMAKVSSILKELLEKKCKDNMK